MLLGFKQVRWCLVQYVQYAVSLSLLQLMMFRVMLFRLHSKRAIISKGSSLVTTASGARWNMLLGLHPVVWNTQQRDIHWQHMVAN